MPIPPKEGALSQPSFLTTYYNTVLLSNVLLMDLSQIGSSLQPIQLLITPLWPLFGIIRVRQSFGFWKQLSGGRVGEKLFSREKKFGRPHWPHAKKTARCSRSRMMGQLVLRRHPVPLQLARQRRRHCAGLRTNARDGRDRRARIR